MLAVGYNVLETERASSANRRKCTNAPTASSLGKARSVLVAPSVLLNEEAEVRSRSASDGHGNRQDA